MLAPQHGMGSLTNSCLRNFQPLLESVFAESMFAESMLANDAENR